jgi:CheY-like chemotaxis protein
MPATRILVVDDEPRITELLPKVLAVHGYEVATASSVNEAVNIITSQKFDVLISDLNMGHIADGFTVVHTMRRVNPDCINFILTGYPAFESALQALRAQVDDYLTKPADIPTLVEAIQRKLKERAPAAANHRPVHRLSTILRENIGTMEDRLLVNVKTNPVLAALPLTDAQRLDDFSQMLLQLADHLDSELPNDANETLMQSAHRRGLERLAQGYPLKLMVACERTMTQVINNIIYENLLDVNLSYLLLDLNKLNDAMLLQLEESIGAFQEAERRKP